MSIAFKVSKTLFLNFRVTYEEEKSPQGYRSKIFFTIRLVIASYVKVDCDLLDNTSHFVFES